MTGSPIANYIATLGAGWYLPSIDELGRLYESRINLNKALNLSGNALLASSYWSSYEWSITNAFNYNFISGYAFNYVKPTSFPVRGVKSF